MNDVVEYYSSTKSSVTENSTEIVRSSRTAVRCRKQEVKARKQKRDRKERRRGSRRRMDLRKKGKKKLSKTPLKLTKSKKLSFKVNTFCPFLPNCATFLQCCFDMGFWKNFLKGNFLFAFSHRFYRP